MMDYVQFTDTFGAVHLVRRDFIVHVLHVSRVPRPGVGFGKGALVMLRDGEKVPCHEIECKRLERLLLESQSEEEI